MQNYKHRPMDPAAREIRLVRVENSSAEEAPVVLELRHTSLDTGHDFNALSYTWGKETPLFPILIRDTTSTDLRIFYVRTNLHEYLQAARVSDEYWGSSWIWIDQICINQDDHAERCHQVSQMEKLYSTAQATLVWPGGSRFEIDKICNNRCDYNDPCRYEARIKSSTPKDRIWPVAPASLQISIGNADADKPAFSLQGIEHICTMITKGKWEDCPSELSPSSIKLLRILTNRRLFDLVTASYWSRAWITQEVILAMKVSVLADGHVWPLIDFLDIVGLIKELDILPHCGCSNSDIVSVIRNVYHRLHDLHHLRYEKGWTSAGARNTATKFVTWTSLLNLRGQTSCTIPLDHVYGVMGLADEKIRLPPDYSISQTALLKKSLLKHLSFSHEYPRGVWLETYDLLTAWFQRVLADFKKEEPDVMDGWYCMDFGPRVDDLDNDEEAVKPRVRKVLHHIGIPLPPELAAEDKYGSQIDTVQQDNL